MKLQILKEKVQSYDKKTYIVIGVLIIAGIIAWNVFSSGLHNNGSGIDKARSDIRSAEQEQQSAISGITDIENKLADSQATVREISDGISQSAESIKTVEDRIDSNESRLNDSAELIAEGKRILANVREREAIKD